MYGVIGINFVDHFLNQGAPAEHKSAETPIGHESVRNPTSGAVASTINISSLILMESPYLLIPRAQLANGVIMNSNQDRLDKGGRGLT